MEELGLRAGDLQASTLYRDAWNRLKKNKMAIASFFLLVIIALIAVFAPLIAPYDPYTQDLSRINEPPSSDHWFGTDDVGRDLFSRVVYGTRISMLVGVVCEAICVPIGVILGALAGYFGGWVDAVISRIIEIFASFPTILFAIAVMFILGPGIMNIFIAIGVIGWTGLARMIRGQIMQLKEKEFVEAARASGASNMKIIFRHLIPNCLSTIIVVITLDIPGDIMLESTLSFVGLGVQPPDPSWGSMISEGRKFIRQNVWYSFFPGLAIMLVVLAFNTLGDGVRDALDPKLKNL
ncbi:MAG TPA: ABC transporter permease [Candidatus Ventrousia excrementavium]|uniref:ABC transporter permease n=1 Tax=Candidatus Ventrousia excrementavium TaxID=2840961 RepID=A0A9D1LL78_9CLOT|nr:ABC transporter permease [Candidatus Ventrousia excrementavium]